MNGASFWNDTAPVRIKSRREARRMRPNPFYQPHDQLYREQPRVSVRADLLAQAAEPIADRDPALANLFRRMTAPHPQEQRNDE